MKTPPEEVMKALADLEKSTAAFRGQLDNPAALAHHIDEAIDAVTTDAVWLRGTINRWIKEETSDQEG